MARRRYQKGQLFVRGKHPVWIGRWREDVLENGTLRRVYRARVLGTLKELPTKRLAQRELDKHLAQVNNPAYRPTVSVTFTEFVEKWKSSVLTQHKPSTQAAIRSQLSKTLIPFFGSYALRDIQTEVLQSFVSNASGAPKTVRNLVGTLRMLWSTAKSWGYVQHDPFEGLVMPKAKRPEPRYFTTEEVQKILSESPEPYRTFFWLAAETGLRAGELCGLRVCDFDPNRLTLSVRQTVWGGRVQTPKTQCGTRVVACSPQLGRALGALVLERTKDQAASADSPLLFATRNGRPWDANTVVRRRLHPVLKKLGIPQAGLHAFRHFQASAMDGEQLPVQLRLQRLGHTDFRTTLGYTHVISEDEREFVDKLGDILHSQCTQNSNGPRGISLGH